MRILLFGATGMVGQGVLRECLLDAEVTQVQTIGRTATGQTHPKLKELVHADLFNYEAIKAELTGFDACFFCLGTPSFRKSEADYRRITHDLTMEAARTLSKLNPRMTFIYVSGDGADTSETGPVMWARIRGRTENALQLLNFNAVYIFRLGIIQPLHGIKSKTFLYRVFYSLAKPVLPLLRKKYPNVISTTEQIGRAMLHVAKRGADRPLLKSQDFERVLKA